MGTLSPIHWVLVAIVVLLVFGPKTLAKMGQSVGKGVRSVNNLKQGFAVDPLKVITEPLPAKKRAVADAPKAKESAPAAAAETPPGEAAPADAPSASAAPAAARPDAASEKT